MLQWHQNDHRGQCLHLQRGPKITHTPPLPLIQSLIAISEKVSFKYRPMSGGGERGGCTSSPLAVNSEGSFKQRGEKMFQNFSKVVGFRKKNTHCFKRCREIRGPGVDRSHSEQEGKLPEPKLAPGFISLFGFITQLPRRFPLVYTDPCSFFCANCRRTNRDRR